MLEIGLGIALRSGQLGAVGGAHAVAPRCCHQHAFEAQQAGHLDIRHTLRDQQGIDHRAQAGQQHAIDSQHADAQASHWGDLGLRALPRRTCERRGRADRR
jgi:hypothetical protein